MGSTDTSAVPGVCAFVHGVCRCSTVNFNLETHPRNSFCWRCVQFLWPGSHSHPLPLDWGDGDGKGRILILPRFNHPGFPHWLGDGPILPTTKKAVPGNEPSLTSSATLLWREGSPVMRPQGLCPGAGQSRLSCLWPCVGPSGHSLALRSWPAVPPRAQRRVQPSLLTPGFMALLGEQGEDQELS